VSAGLQNQDLSYPFIAEILCRVHGLSPGGISVALCMYWVPSSVGLAGNSAADIAAKAALLLAVSNLNVPHSDSNSLLSLFCLFNGT